MKKITEDPTDEPETEDRKLTPPRQPRILRKLNFIWTAPGIQEYFWEKLLWV
ncbi:MAG: hypothetical protein U5N58_02480 [Actinomycetota bacterium]|nr:hypothetical protein [Actinomycetota bacterium]